MPKSPDAFRTISEVADWLDVQAHVLRFWESKFSQVKPIKRAGGRRYYRPGDMLLLGGIKKLLHEDGLTIKGVQKILREEGMGHVSDMSAPLDDLLAELVDNKAAPEKPVVEEETAVVLDFAPADVEADAEKTAVDADADADADGPQQAADATPSTEEPQEPSADDEVAPPAEETSALPDFVQQPLDATPEALETDNLPAATAAEDSVDVEVSAPAATEEPSDEKEENVAADTVDADPEPPADTEEPVADAPPQTPKPRIIDIPPLTPEAEIAAQPSTLSAAFRSPGLTAAQARDVAPLLQQLTALRDRMQAARQGGAAKG